VATNGTAASITFSVAAVTTGGDPLIPMPDFEDEDQALMFEKVGLTVGELEIERSRVAAPIS